MLARRIICQSFSKFTLRSLLPLIQQRNVRFKASGDHNGSKTNGKEHENVKDNEKKSKDEQKTSEEEEKIKEKMKIPPEMIRKIRILGFVSFMGSAVLTYFMFQNASDVTRGLGDPISFEEFVEKFIKTGEVRYILYNKSSNVALANLHDGAIIDGKPWPGHQVLVKYVDNSGEPNKFEADVRRVEDSLGVRPQDRMTVSIVEGMSTRKIIELLIAFAIMFFLFGQYGKLIRNRLAQNTKQK
ncbi:unnamed protein product [Bursaphelenchus okinawaensis]|uniref:Uncharacterized protein n=1 Tax=Bursaphelenchus okinawaensis TaxID=465554 RepID=A0A811KB73_9BILA|nr:unnamed protein product [Bursaphelenchus okinawaensis]CAG9095254.1 unnamed protein product [Bursaphelenchus okinawaensis]